MCDYDDIRDLIEQAMAFLSDSEKVWRFCFWQVIVWQINDVPTELFQTLSLCKDTSWIYCHCVKIQLSLRKDAYMIYCHCVKMQLSLRKDAVAFSGGFDIP